jgi:hypothetical protein
LTDEQYPQRSIAIEFAQDKCEVYLIYIKKVIAFKVSINLRGVNGLTLREQEVSILILFKAGE